MSLASDGGYRAFLRHELEALHGNWGWYLALGIILIIAGTVAIALPLATALTTWTVVLVFGILLLLGGGAHAVGAFWTRRWSGFFAHLLIGILYLVAGLFTVANPGMAAVTLTLVIAMFLIVGGVFRIVAALTARFPNWGMLLLNGVITLLLGVLVWRQWPGDAPWVIGLFVGIEMIFSGWTWAMLALAFRRLPRGA